MESYFAPELGLAAAQGALSGDDRRIALVLPTTRAVIEHVQRSQSAWTVIGNSDRMGVQCATVVFRHLSMTQKQTPVIVHTDQLYQPADATILALRNNGGVHLSPVECILNDKYGYRLLVWTATGLRGLPTKSPVKEIVSLTVQHLHDCSMLGLDWLERDQQVQRTTTHRIKAGRLQLRFLRSSVANAYMGEPANPMVDTLIERICDIGRVLEKGRPG